MLYRLSELIKIVDTFYTKWLHFISSKFKESKKDKIFTMQTYLSEKIVALISLQLSI